MTKGWILSFLLKYILKSWLESSCINCAFLLTIQFIRNKSLNCLNIPRHKKINVVFSVYYLFLAVFRSRDSYLHNVTNHCVYWHKSVMFNWKQIWILCIFSCKPQVNLAKKILSIIILNDNENDLKYYFFFIKLEFI